MRHTGHNRAGLVSLKEWVVQSKPIASDNFMYFPMFWASVNDMLYDTVSHSLQHAALLAHSKLLMFQFLPAKLFVAILWLIQVICCFSMRFDREDENC